MSNVGSVDRIVRIVAGLLLIAFANPIGFPQTGWNWVGWIGVVPIRLRDVRAVQLSGQPAGLTGRR